jgi:ferredoxin like protein
MSSDNKTDDKNNNNVKNYLEPCESLSVEDRLFKTRFKADTEAHLVVDIAVCKTCTHKACTYVCPVQNYTINDDNDVIVSWEGCLECGACRVACTPGGVTWKYPNGGMGVCLRQG